MKAPTQYVPLTIVAQGQAVVWTGCTVIRPITIFIEIVAKGGRKS